MYFKIIVINCLSHKSYFEILVAKCETRNGTCFYFMTEKQLATCVCLKIYKYN